MPIDMSIIKARLAKLENKGSSSTNGPNPLIWRPQEGTTSVRILPLEVSPEIPFLEVYTHYFDKRRPYNSPLTFGNSDPIADFVNATLDQVKESGERLTTEEFKNLVKLRPTAGTVALVLVRGEEELGPRFFRFGKTNAEKLLRVMADFEEWGDITDPQEGNDIKVTYVPKDKSPTKYPVVEIDVSPKKTPISKDAALVKRCLTGQPKLVDAFPAESAAVLQEALEKHLQAEVAPVASDWEEPATTEEESPSAAKSSEIKARPSAAAKVDFDAVFND